MLKVVVLAGGNSDEKAVSKLSGAAVATALTVLGYDVTIIDPSGKAFNAGELTAYDVAFVALHGAGGEDGGIQKELETHGIAFTGSDSRSSALCFDKYRYWQLLKANNVQQPMTEVVNNKSFHKSNLIKQPFVLKPNAEGSSIDTFIVKQLGNRPVRQIEAAFSKHSQMLLQPWIEGLEITVGVLGDEPLPIVEIIPPADSWFDYDNKYNGKTDEICPSRHLSQHLQQKAQALALRIHHLTGCRDMSRTDMIVSSDQQIYVLETNTVPGLTGRSLLPKAAAVAGLDMAQLCGRLVEAAYKRQFTA